MNSIQPREHENGCQYGNGSGDIEHNLHRRSGQQSAKVHRGRFAFSLAFILSTDADSGDSPEVVAGIFADAADEEILLFINHIGTVVFAHFEVRRELNCISRTGFLAISAEDTARKIDTKEFRVPAA